MVQIKEIAEYLETIAPLALQESYDNAGLIVGDASAEVSSALVTLDVTEEVVDEDIANDVGIIGEHHARIFSGGK